MIGLTDSSYDFDYYVLVSSLIISFISHATHFTLPQFKFESLEAYTGTKLLYPSGNLQSMVAFVFTVCDTAFRSFGFLYVL